MLAKVPARRDPERILRGWRWPDSRDGSFGGPAGKSWLVPAWVRLSADSRRVLTDQSRMPRVPQGGPQIRAGFAGSTALLLNPLRHLGRRVRRKGNAERLCHFDVDNEIELAGLLDR